METILQHPDGTFVFEYADQTLQVSVIDDDAGFSNSVKLHITPIGLIDLGQQLMAHGLEKLSLKPA